MPSYELRVTVHKLNDEPTARTVHPEDSAQYLLKNCYDPAEMWREKAFALFLDKANNVIGHLLLSVGGTDSTTLDVKLIAKGAVDVLASKVILSHNHPSGNPLPGATDISMTNKIREALAILDIELLDHVIICDGKGYSFNTQSVFIIK